jgi:hypothetical protein
LAIVSSFLIGGDLDIRISSRLPPVPEVVVQGLHLAATCAAAPHGGTNHRFAVSGRLRNGLPPIWMADGYESSAAYIVSMDRQRTTRASEKDITRNSAGAGDADDPPLPNSLYSLKIRSE